jgi:hypothetical protein
MYNLHQDNIHNFIQKYRCAIVHSTKSLYSQSESRGWSDSFVGVYNKLVSAILDFV